MTEGQETTKPRGRGQHVKTVHFGATSDGPCLTVRLVGNLFDLTKRERVLIDDLIERMDAYEAGEGDDS